MSCTELGLSEYGLRLSKSVDTEIIGSAPTTTDLTGYTAEFVIRATEGAATALLTVTETPTASGSVVVFADNLITLRLKQDDIATVPDNGDDPYVGTCELVIVAPTGLRSRVFYLSAIVEKGVAR